MGKLNYNKNFTWIYRNILREGWSIFYNTKQVYIVRPDKCGILYINKYGQIHNDDDYASITNNFKCYYLNNILYAKEYWLRWRK